MIRYYYETTDNGLYINEVGSNDLISKAEWYIEDNTIWLDILYTSERFRRKNFGTLCLGKWLESIKSKNQSCTEIRLKIMDENDSEKYKYLKRLYNKFGFECSIYDKHIMIQSI